MDASRSTGPVARTHRMWGALRRSGEEAPRLVVATFSLAGLCAVAFIVIGATSSTGDSGDLWFELAKGGIQLLTVVILGGAVAAAFRSLDARRDDRRRLDEFRAGFVHELLDAYRRIKAVRRSLRASGMRAPTGGSVSPEQSADFRTQMEVLVDAQLTLEELARDVRTQTQLFGPDGDRIGSLIRTSEKHINHAIGDWEKHGNSVRPGADLAEAVGPLEHLQAFLASASKGGFKENVSEPIVEAARLIQSLRLDGARSTGSGRVTK
jgi:hypothetical protein